MLAINDSNFEELVVNSQVPVLLDFWATWCGPCRMISPIVEELANEYEGKWLIAKCNVDEATDVPMKFGIRNVQCGRGYRCPHEVRYPQHPDPAFLQGR